MSCPIRTLEFSGERRWTTCPKLKRPYETNMKRCGMIANLIHSPTWHRGSDVLAEIALLVPPRPPLPEAPAVAPPMIYVQKHIQWEYKQLVRNLGKAIAPTADELNTLGQEGWELTGVTTDAAFATFVLSVRKHKVAATTFSVPNINKIIAAPTSPHPRQSKVTGVAQRSHPPGRHSRRGCHGRCRRPATPTRCYRPIG